MRPLIAILLLCMIAILSNCKSSQNMVSKAKYIALQDSIQLFKVNTTSLASEKETLKVSIQLLNVKIDSLQVETEILNDSIEDLLIRPMMTNEHFVMIYKFLSIKKYFLLCEKNHTQYKFFKGWVIQAILE